MYFLQRKNAKKFSRHQQDINMNGLSHVEGGSIDNEGERVSAWNG
jgi:hypothetical protein